MVPLKKTFLVLQNGLLQTLNIHTSFVTLRPRIQDVDCTPSLQPAHLGVLYDGSSAAKFPGGSMDSQDVLIWEEVKPNWTFEDVKRLNDLCQCGTQSGIDGFVRCVSTAPMHGNCL